MDSFRFDLSQRNENSRVHKRDKNDCHLCTFFFLALATVLQIHIVVNRIYFIHLFKKKNGSHSAGLGPAFYL